MSARRLATLAMTLALLGACTETEPGSEDTDEGAVAATALVEIEGAPDAITHGDDQLPPKPPGLVAQVAPEVPWPCEGTGTDGRRVQLVYAHGGSGSLPAERPTLETFARQIEGMFSLSAQATGGERRLRFVTGEGCALSILDAPVSATGLSSFDAMINELRAKGMTDTNRAYLAYTEGRSFCGIGTVYSDDRPTDNYNERFAQYSRVDRGCWDARVGAHEALHNLGAVQNSAPNSTGGLHCRDEHDVMCYADGAPKGQMVQVCTDPVGEDRLDCRGDDYYSTAPEPGSYLDNHWNVADSSALSSTSATTLPPPPPTSSTTLPPTTTTSTVVDPVTTNLELTVPRRIQRTEPFLAVARVTGDNAACQPAGTVTFKVSGKTMSVQPLDASGTATVTLTIEGAVKRPTIRADFGGSPGCGPSTDSVRKRVAG